MSKNIYEIYQANPANSFQNADLFYLGRSPYGAQNDMACTFETLASQFNQFSWEVITGPTAMTQNTGYVVQGTGVTTLTLPSTCLQFSILHIVGSSVGGWILNQNSGQSIIFGNQKTTTTTGSLSSTNGYDCIQLMCIVANTTFQVINGTMSSGINIT